MKKWTKRKAKWQPREPKVTTGYLARYAAMVTSGDRGAILEVQKISRGRYLNVINRFPNCC